MLERVVGRMLHRYQAELIQVPFGHWWGTLGAYCAWQSLHTVPVPQSPQPDSSTVPLVLVTPMVTKFWLPLWEEIPPFVQ